MAIQAQEAQSVGANGRQEEGAVAGTVLEGVRAKVFLDRYSLKDPEGKPIEQTPEQMWRRVARGIAAVEPTPALRAYWEEQFYQALQDFRFVPGGRVLSSAGTGFETTYYNCFVIPSPDDSRGGILDNLKILTEIMARGGGVGVNLSTLRPRGSYIKTVNGTASGPVSWAELYSVITGDVIQQGGCFGPDQRIATDAGLLPAVELADRIEQGEVINALTHDGPRRITWAFRNGVKPLFRVTTARGFQVDVTEEHKMGVLRQGALTTVPLAELVVGDEVLLFLGDGPQAGYIALDAPAYERSVMSTRLNEGVRLPEILDERLAYFLGYFHGDGYVHWGHKVTWRAPKAIKLATADAYPAIRERLVALARDLFGLEAIVERQHGEACTRVAIYSRVLVEWLQHHGLLKAFSDGVRVPEPIFRSPASVMGAFIAGYFDADGSDRGRKGGYGFDSVSLGMLRDVQQLLAVNGILSHIATTDRSGQGWRTIHRLIVTGAEFKERMAGFIKLSLKAEHTAGLRNHHHSYPRSIWSNLELPGRYYQRLWDATKPRISYRALSRVQDRLVADGQVALAERVQQLLHTVPDSIIAIEPLGQSEVYDFEVEDVHMLSGNGLYTSNSRRGALMIMLDDDHPDIVEFIHAKKIDPLTNRPVAIEHANISVAVSDAFMQAVEEDADWPTQFPTRAMVAADPALADKVKPGPTYRARAIWRMICESAWATAEPGVVFIDRYNAWNNTWYYQTIRCTNPCGEQGLAAWNVCNLAALNLSTFVTGPLGAGEFDYEALARFARIGLRFSDNVIDANRYFFQENADEQLGTRRTGLGTMGLADALIKLGVRYGSPESEPIIERIYRTIRDAAYDASADLAAEKGAFPRFDRDRYLQGRFIRTLPAELQAKIAKQGIRNAVILTQAPTGTTSLLAGVSSGIEPVFDFAFKRVDRTGEHIIYHPLLKQWMDEHPGQERPDYFVGANDLTPEDHIRVQAMVQKYTDSSISKTCNAPNSHTVEEVERLYRLAYASGCKGVTYYRDGSRDAVLHHLDDKKKEEPRAETPKAAAAPAPAIDTSIRPLPAVVHGYTRKMQAPEGKVNITLNSDEQGLLEVFVNVGRAGSDIAALAEALGRLISLIQRLPSPLTADERAQLVVNQLRGIGGSRTVGFGLEQVRSLPDAIGLALQKHLEGQVTPAPAGRAGAPVSQPALPGLLNGAPKVTGNLCPECGSTAFVFEEGCKKCHACGYSEC
jgi:ribonucleoside-diphosphate reductase alpha chain